MEVCFCVATIGAVYFGLNEALSDTMPSIAFGTGMLYDLHTLCTQWVKMDGLDGLFAEGHHEQKAELVKSSASFVRNFLSLNKTILEAVTRQYLILTCSSVYYVAKIALFTIEQIEIGKKQGV
jgi:hypothetical protein